MNQWVCDCQSVDDMDVLFEFVGFGKMQCQIIRLIFSHHSDTMKHLIYDS